MEVGYWLSYDAVALVVEVACVDILGSNFDLLLLWLCELTHDVHALLAVDNLKVLGPLSEFVVVGWNCTDKFEHHINRVEEGIDRLDSIKMNS